MKLTVSLFGKNFDITCEPGEELFFHSVASYINNRTEEIKKEHADTIGETTAELPVYTAFYIAEDFFKLQNKVGHRENMINEKTKNLISLIDNVLENDDNV